MFANVSQLQEVACFITGNYKYRQNFDSAITISDKSHASAFLKTTVSSCHFIRLADFLYPFVDGEF